MTSIAQDLKKWRLSHQVTQQDAADVLQVSLTSYQRWEADRRVPPYREVQRLRSTMRELDAGAGLWRAAVRR